MNIKIKLANNSLWAILASIFLIVFVLFDISKNNQSNTDNIFIDAENAYNVGDYSKSKTLFQKIVANNPNDLFPKIRIADILTKAKKYDSAIEYINSIKDVNTTNDAVVLQKLAENYFYKKNYDKSEELINASLNINKNNLFLIKMMTNIQLIQGNYQDAQAFLSTFDETLFNDDLLFNKRIIQIYNKSLENSSGTNFKDMTLQNLFIKIENNLEDYNATDTKIFGATNICFELLQYNYFELAKPFSEDIINYNKYMDHGYFYKGLSLLSMGYTSEAQELFKQAYSIKDSNVDNSLMVVLTNIVLNQSDQIDDSLEKLSKVLLEQDKYKLMEILKYANDNQKGLLALKIFEKFPQYLNDDLVSIYFKVKFNAINDNYNNLLGDINRLFAESHYLNDRQKALLLGIKGYIIAKETNPIAGKDLILQGLELDNYSTFCYYFLSKVNLLQNDKVSYDINYAKAKEFDLYQELKYE
mgnify:CR=1 FL=1